MPTVSVKAEIPDGRELACEKIRKPRDGESYILNGRVETWVGPGSPSHEYVIVRHEYQWPSWLREDIVSIASDQNGEWWSYVDVCEMSDNGWDGPALDSLHAIDPSLLPQVTNWRESRRIKPGHEVQS